jgi:hypothetical protein
MRSAFSLTDIFEGYKQWRCSDAINLTVVVGSHNNTRPINVSSDHYGI